MTSVKTRLDGRGRLQLPAALRRRLGLRPGDEVVITDEPDGARLSSRHVAARALIGLAGKMNHSALEELRQLREREAVDEDLAADDALAIAALYPRVAAQGLSLGDRACLAVAQRLNAPALTADRAWADLDLDVEIRLLRL